MAAMDERAAAPDQVFEASSPHAASWNPFDLSTANPPIEALIRTENRTHRPVGGCVLHGSTVEVARTPWIRLQTLTYTNDVAAAGGATGDNNVKWRKWDMATRTTKPSPPTLPNGDAQSQVKAKKALTADAVAVFARVRALRDDGQPRVLLVQQYRPAVDAVTVELPAGLIDAGETPAQAALRELREETGYTGVVAAVLPPAPLSPGLSDESVALVVVDVIGNSGANERAAEDAGTGADEGEYPKPEGQTLDESENIHVVSVPVARLHDALVYMAEVLDMKVMHAIWTLGVGVALGRPM